MNQIPVIGRPRSCAGKLYFQVSTAMLNMANPLDPSSGLVPKFAYCADSWRPQIVDVLFSHNINTPVFIGAIFTRVVRALPGEMYLITLSCKIIITGIETDSSANYRSLVSHQDSLHGHIPNLLFQPPREGNSEYISKTSCSVFFPRPLSD